LQAFVLRGWTSGELHPAARVRVALEGIRETWGEVPSGTLPRDHVLVRVGFRILPFFSGKRSCRPESITILLLLRRHSERFVFLSNSSQSRWLSGSIFPRNERLVVFIKKREKGKKGMLGTTKRAASNAARMLFILDRVLNRAR